MRRLRSGIDPSRFAEPIAGMPDSASRFHVSDCFLRSQAGAVIRRSLERYVPATRLIEPVQLATTPLSG